MTELPNVTLEQLQQAVSSVRFSRRRASDLALDKGEKPKKAQIRICDLNVILCWFGNQERIEKLYSNDKEPQYAE